MKLLLDENLPRSLCRTLAARFPGITHVHDVGLTSSPDEQVWEFARTGGYTLVSKDSDFNQLSFLRGAPPKVVWVRLGNCSTTEICEVLTASVDVVEEFIASEEATVLLLSRSGPPLVT